MVTKRNPKAIIGRLKKKITSFSERRARGRPEIKFLDHPDQYVCALLRAMYVSNRLSKTRAAQIIAGFQAGYEKSPDLITDRAER